MACTPPSTPASRPAQSWSAPHTSLALVPATFRKHLAVRRRQSSPIPTGRTPGSLSRATNLPLMRALIAAQGGVPLAIHSVKSATAMRRRLLALPCFKRRCLRRIESTPPKPAPPDKEPATSWTMSSEKMLGTRQGVVSQGCNAAGSTALGSGCFSLRTSLTGLPVLVSLSSGRNTPPFSRSVMYRTAPRRLPLSTILWKVLARCSGVVVPWALDIPAWRFLRHSSVSSWNSPLSQRSIFCLR